MVGDYENGSERSDFLTYYRINTFALYKESVRTAL